jgi:Rhodopirellula transposase DDE domain
MFPYNSTIEQGMKDYFATLSEKDRRRYAGVEALKLGRGGAAYLANLFGINRKTVRKGKKEVVKLSTDEKQNTRIRKKGAGRKRYDKKYPDIHQKFLETLKNYTAGDPMDEKVRWTNLKPWQIAERLASQYDIGVSLNVIRQLLKKHGYRRRKIQKRTTKKNVKHRNEQFENIIRLKAEFEAAGNPVASMDTKKKEHLGNLYRDGQLYTLEELRTLDHDFASYAEGVVIPHSIYDLKYNTGYINLGTSKETSEFACDSLRKWWYDQGQSRYPNATAILILCDGGGSNSSRHYIFKQDLQELVDELGIDIRIAHYPPYCSKHNPIEHRLFPHVTRACQGVVFKNIELVKELIAGTTTSKGLTVTVKIIDKVYETKRKVADDFKETMRIVFDEVLPQWNYTAAPNG